MFLDEVIARRDHAEAGLPAYVMLQPQHRDGCILIEEPRDLCTLLWIVTLRLTKISGRRIRCEQKAEGVSSDLSRELRSNIGADDGAGVHGLKRGAEDVDALEKERTLLLKENREALIRGDHRLVGFHVGKIRIQRESDSYVRPDSILHGKARLKLWRLINELSRIRRGGVSCAHPLSAFRNS